MLAAPGTGLAQPSEELHDRLGPARLRWPGTACAASLPEFVMAEPVHGSDVNQQIRPSNPENASPEDGKLAESGPLRRHWRCKTRAAPTTPVRYPEPMQRVALLT